MKTKLSLLAIMMAVCLQGWAQTPEEKSHVYWAQDFPGKDMGEKISNGIASIHGGTIKIPVGQFPTSPIQINKNIRLEGSGKTTLVPTNPKAVLIEVLPGADYTTISDMRIYQPQGRPTAGAGIQVHAGYVRISNVTIWNEFDGIEQAGQNLYVDNCDIRCVNDNIRLNGRTGTMISSCHLYADGPSTGIHLIHAAGVWLTDDEIYGGARGIVFDPPPGGGVGQVFAKGVVVDTVDQDAILVGGSAIVYQVEFTDSWAAGSKTGNGIHFTNPRTNGFTWMGGFIRGNHLNGVSIEAGKNISILGAQISANGLNNKGPDNTYGVKVGHGVDHFRVVDCFLGPTGYDPRTQTYGIVIEPGADYFQILNNMDTGDTRGPLEDRSGASHKVVANNL